MAHCDTNNHKMRHAYLSEVWCKFSIITVHTCPIRQR